jgi:hypothetical protein
MMNVIVLSVVSPILIYWNLEVTFTAQWTIFAKIVKMHFFEKLTTVPYWLRFLSKELDVFAFKTILSLICTLVRPNDLKFHFK